MIQAQAHNFTYGPYTWWVGVVEDRDGDPLQIGRVKVRIFGYHSEDTGEVSTDDLPWAVVVMGADSATSAGVGRAPVGLVNGSHVVGFFADGSNAQVPLVTGTIPGIVNGKPDTNELVRGEDLNNTVIAEKKASILQSNALASARDALSLAQSVTNATNLVQNQSLDLRKKLGILDFKLPTGITQIKGFDDINNIAGQLRDQVQRIEQQIFQLRTIQDSVENFNAKRLVDQEVAGFKNRIKSLQYHMGGAQLGDLQAAVRSIDNIKNAANTLQKADSALRSIQSLSGAAGNIKRLASSIAGGGAVKSIINSLTGGAMSNTWAEPPTPANPMYPLNDVYVTEGGHIVERDNTPGAERLHEYHPSGTFHEVHPNGTEVTKVVNDKYSITMGDDYIHVDGDVKVNIAGKANVVINGDCVLQVNGNRTDTINGDYTVAIGGDYSLVVGGAHNQTAGSQFKALAPRIDLNE